MPYTSYLYYFLLHFSAKYKQTDNGRTDSYHGVKQNKKMENSTGSLPGQD